MREIVLRLPAADALALALFCKRIDFETCVRFASVFTTYDGRAEADVIWSAVLSLQRQLAEAGYAPR